MSRAVSCQCFLVEIFAPRSRSNPTTTLCLKTTTHECRVPEDTVPTSHSTPSTAGRPAPSACRRPLLNHSRPRRVRYRYTARRAPGRNAARRACPPSGIRRHGDRAPAEAEVAGSNVERHALGMAYFAGYPTAPGQGATPISSGASQSAARRGAPTTPEPPIRRMGCKSMMRLPYGVEYPTNGRMLKVDCCW